MCALLLLRLLQSLLQPMKSKMRLMSWMICYVKGVCHPLVDGFKVGRRLHDRPTVREMAARFRSHFPGRQAINWALLGVCVKEV